MAMKLSSASNSTNMGWAMVIIKVPHINLFANRSINGRSGMENVYSLHVSKCRVINSVRQLNEVGRKYWSSQSDPGAAIQISLDEGCQQCNNFASPQVPCSAGLVDSTGGARWDACTSLQGPSDDIEVGLHAGIRSRLDTLLDTGWRTHTRHGVKRCSSGKGLRQMIPELWCSSGNSVPYPPWVASYIVCLFVH